MSSRYLSNISSLLIVPALILGFGLGGVAFAAAAQPVQTYADQAVPGEIPANDGYYNSPLAAGTLTLQDVLEAHRPPPGQASAPKLPALGGTPSATTTAPILTPPVQSATSMMMSQGMKEVLQKVGTSPSSPAASAPVAATPAQPPAPAQAVAQPVALTPAPPAEASAIQYQPGQEPKNLASCCAAATSSVPLTTETNPASVPTPVANAAVPVSPSSNSSAISASSASSSSSAPSASDQSCNQNVQKWEKSCGDAGYPATYVGKIVGETRTGCSDGVLHDVWVTNSCAPPDTTAQAAKTDGVCGAASNNEFDDTPAANLCGQGVASPVSGDGPWTWACSGINGGVPAACIAHKRVAPLNGACGSANGAAATAAPSTGLCDAGMSTQVKGSGPWMWSCKGAGNGRSESCIAPVSTVAAHDVIPVPVPVPVASEPAKAPAESAPPESAPTAAVESAAPVHASADSKGEASDMLCGEAAETLAYEAPSTDLCRAGTPSAVNGDGPWTWSCTNNEGVTSSCRTLSLSNDQAPAAAPAPAVTSRPVPEPTAKPAKSGKSKTSRKQPAPESAPSEIAAAPVPEAKVETPAPTPTPAPKAQESESSGDEPASMPSSAPTATPQPPAVEGASPAVSSLLAQAGGSASSAGSAAPEAAELACGLAASQSTQLPPTTELCQGGKASAVRGSNPWRWTCSKGKRKVSCETKKMVDGSCGPANGAALKSAPFAGLCSSGAPTGITGDGPWMWTCAGSGGGNDVSCAASLQSKPDKIDGICGTSSGANLKAAPSDGLCNGGTPSGVSGDGPWVWSCSGSNGGKVDSCAANKIAAPKPPGPSVNGLCGSASGMTTSSAPTEGLCSTGAVSDIVGNGPWNWSCIGENGGMTVSCTAPLSPPAPIDGACGAANGVTTLVVPQSGLCSSGLTGIVSGKGPWTWTCSGANGGEPASCMAPVAGKSAAMPSMMTTDASTTGFYPPVGSVPASTGLVTPHLPSPSNLPPMEANVIPSLSPSKSFASAPSASVVPAPVTITGDAAPDVVPGLPDGSVPVQPPTFKEPLPPAPVLQESPVVPSSRLPGNHLTLDPTISTVLFTRGSENIDDSVIMTLDKIAGVLQTNPDVRISLLAYADNTGSTPRDARRLSLKRALAVRGYLTSKGISESRVDIHAEGANAAAGYADRVDVKVND